MGCRIFPLPSIKWTRRDVSCYSWTEAVAKPPILPKWFGDASGEGRMEVVMPHDPKYGALPGEGLPGGPRLEGLPRRFVREGRTWRPCE